MHVLCILRAFARTFNSERSDFIILSRARRARSLLIACGLSQLRNRNLSLNICLVSASDVMEHFAFPGNIDFAADYEGSWNRVYHRWIMNNFPCKWHTSTTSGSKSSPRKVFHRNSSGARTPTSNSAWTTKEKTSTRNCGAEGASLSTARQRRQQETEEQEIGIRGIMIVLYCRKPRLIS